MSQNRLKGSPKTSGYTRSHSDTEKQMATNGTNARSSALIGGAFTHNLSYNVVMAHGDITKNYAAGSECVTNSENFARSIFPPLTTQTIFPGPHFPLSPAATAQAPAPSLTT